MPAIRTMRSLTSTAAAMVKPALIDPTGLRH
jgi:hypothetical protein